MLVKDVKPGAFFVTQVFEKGAVNLYRKLASGEIVRYRQGGGAGDSAILLTEGEQPVQFSNNVEVALVAV